MLVGKKLRHKENVGTLNRLRAGMQINTMYTGIHKQKSKDVLYKLYKVYGSNEGQRPMKYDNKALRPSMTWVIIEFRTPQISFCVGEIRIHR